MTVIAVTRSMPDAERTAERVRSLGAEPVVAPLLTISPRGYDTNVEGAQALLFTSAHGVRAFPDARKLHAIPVLTVGDATAEAACEAGFTNVRSADGDVHALAALARTVLAPGAGKLVHIAGAHVAGNLVGTLRSAGYDAERRIAYEAVPAQAMPAALRQPVDIVLFHSARAALTYCRLCAPQEGARTAACLSAAVAEAAAKTDWARIIVAPTPREDILLRAALTPYSPAGAGA